MESIFHEKQEGSLCAQHCLNALLQNQYFSAVDLAQIGRRLDERERDRMAEGGVGSNEYQQFIEQPSSNYDDSGFFSIQVITEALSVWGLEVVLLNSQDPIAVQAREDPTHMSAFICNYHQHWFCVRKLGEQWFNLNSLLTSPELISNTYLSLFLTQLQREGYSIFIVTGALPECESDQLLRLIPAVQTVKPRLLTEGTAESQEAGVEDEEDDALREALRVSKEMIDNDDTALQAVLQMSMEGHNTPSAEEASLSTRPITLGASSPSDEAQPASQDDLRQKRLAFYSRQLAPPGDADSSGNASDSRERSPPDGEPSEEDLLQQAIALSMEIKR